MTNMSYCRFENTYHDLQDCKEALDNPDELSPDEKKYKDKLVKLCQYIANNYKDKKMAKKDKHAIKFDTFWVTCPKCGEFMNMPTFDPKTGKAYHSWCIPKSSITK